MFTKTVKSYHKCWLDQPIPFFSNICVMQAISCFICSVALRLFSWYTGLFWEVLLIYLTLQWWSLSINWASSSVCVVGRGSNLTLSISRYDLPYQLFSTFFSDMTFLCSLCLIFKTQLISFSYSFPHMHVMLYM